MQLVIVERSSPYRNTIFTPADRADGLLFDAWRIEEKGDQRVPGIRL